MTGGKAPGEVHINQLMTSFCHGLNTLISDALASAEVQMSQLDTGHCQLVQYGISDMHIPVQGQLLQTWALCYQLCDTCICHPAEHKPLHIQSVHAQQAYCACEQFKADYGIMCKSSLSTAAISSTCVNALCKKLNMTRTVTCSTFDRHSGTADLCL